MKFRKKPVVIEAEQFDLSAPNGVCFCYKAETDQAHIHTLEGIMKVTHGDWIITGVKGERYPCKPDIFQATYEAV